MSFSKSARFVPPLFVCACLALLFDVLGFSGIIDQSRGTAATPKTYVQQNLLWPDLPSRWREQVGSWQGNTWIPPHAHGWRYYSTLELQSFYLNRSMVWVGDSTARRTSMTLYALLESPPVGQGEARVHQVPYKSLSNRTLIDVNKNRATVPCRKYRPVNVNVTVQNDNSTTTQAKLLPAPRFCRPMPRPLPQQQHNGNGEKEFAFQMVGCTKFLEEFFELELELLKSNHGHYDNVVVHSKDIIVVANGIWDPVRLRDCQVEGRNVTDIVGGTIDKLDELQRQSPGTIIVWRTSGFFAEKLAPGKGSAKRDMILTMNEFAMNRIDELAERYQRQGIRSNLTYVHWGGAVEVRSFGDDRIVGDIQPHYGVEPRLALIQMITNRLEGYYNPHLMSLSY